MANMENTCPAFLREAIPAEPSARDPFITLTYAQSLDAKIAGKDRQQVRLSGEESMRMTHWMRTLHDGIMIGIGTLLNDNPRLNVRLLPPSQHHLCPRPIILDPSLRTPPDARMLLALTDPETPHAKAPVILASDARVSDSEWVARKDALERAGARIHLVPVDASKRFDLGTLRMHLRDLEIRSLMVEGGASVIQQFLAEKRPAEAGESARPFVDCLIVTVAPVMIPDGFGLQDGARATSAPGLIHRHTELMGRDAVFVLTP